MKNVGKDFEQQFQDSLKTCGLKVLRLPDPPQSFNKQTNTMLRFSNKNPYDFEAFLSPHLYCLELKSTQGTSISVQRELTSKTHSIKTHQINGLKNASIYHNVYAGFIFNFRTAARTYWMSINQFLSFIDNSDKKSINEKDIQQFGGIIIAQELKQKKYNFNIQQWLNEICSK